jgi:alpha-glucosidase
MLLLTLRGTPTLYCGDEIGMTDVPIPSNEQQDPWGKRVPGLGRDPFRTPMQWDASQHSGFSPPLTMKTWLPIGKDYQTVNVNTQLQDPTSLLSLYRQLLAYRKVSHALQVGDYSPFEEVQQNCFAYLRQMAGFPKILVALNFSSSEAELNFASIGMGHLILSTCLDRSEPVDLSTLSLRGHEGVLIEVQD